VSAYLLDTSTCVASLKRRPTIVLERLTTELRSSTSIAVSTIVLLELWYGIERSAESHRKENLARLATFLRGQLDLLVFDATDGRRAASICKTLNAAGMPIGAYDLLIAAQAVERGMILVTSNLREFQRVEGLTCEDWAQG
jgi:tRNA(fMet)-specific endonuclease VapC